MKKISHRVHRENREKFIFSKNSVFYVAKLFLLFTFAFLLCFSACSIPNLEKPECTEARNAIREFYSFHIGNDMKPSAENLKLREKFLSKELLKTLLASSETARDYFTATDDYAKAFRVGSCEVISPERVRLGLLLFWRDDTRSEQREIKVEAVKENEKWLIDKVSE